MHVRGEFLDAFVRFLDIGPQFRVRGQRRIPQPIMADHSFFIRVGNCARFQFTHGRESLVDLRPHFGEEIVRKFHPADVDGKIEVVVAQEILLKPLPK